jgi:hypothetical protein
MLQKGRDEGALARMEALLRGSAGPAAAGSSSSNTPAAAAGGGTSTSTAAAAAAAAGESASSDWNDTSSSLMVIPDRDRGAEKGCVGYDKERDRDRDRDRDIHSTTNPSPAPAPAPGPGMDMEDAMLQEAGRERRAWEGCIDRYSSMQPSGVEFSEGRLILGEVWFVAD